MTDVLQEILDAAFPTSGTEGPNAWTEERIRVRTRFAEQLEHIFAATVDQLAHRPEDDCAYLFGRECDCQEPPRFLARLEQNG